MKAERFIKLSMAAAVVACGLGLSSCGGNGELTKGDVKDEIKRVSGFLTDYYQTTTLQTGYYELNSPESRLNLAKLAAAGMITYKATDIIETTHSRWYGTRKNSHIFVEVALTEKGQKYVVTDEELKKQEEEIKKDYTDEDLVNPDEDKVYPEDAVTSEGNIPVVDDQPETDAASTSKSSKSNSSSKSSSYTADEDCGALEGIAPTTAYEKACAKVNATTVVLKTHKLDIDKVRHIKCTSKMLEVGEGEAEVIWEVVDVTPFGRILENKTEGNKFAREYKFTKYTDGWKIDK